MVGSKIRAAGRLVERIPEHQHYIEVFGGSLALLFAKEPSALETVNDIDQDLINFWLVCRESPDELIDKLMLTPYSRALYERWKREPLPENDRIERAARWFYLSCAAFAGNMGSGWSYLRIKSTCNVPPPERFRRKIARVKSAFHRLANVQIECADFREMIARYGNSEDNFLYLDPPYIHLKWYAHNLEEADHIEMAEMCNASRARIMISYQDKPILARLYKGWSRAEYSSVKTSANTNPGGKKPLRTEVVMTNF